MRQTMLLTRMLLNGFLVLMLAAGLLNAQPHKQYSHIVVLADHDYLKSVAFYRLDDTPRLAESLTTVDDEGTIHVELDLSEPIAMRIKLMPTGTFRFKVDQHFLTSLTIMDEGPHMDLREWKHTVSDSLLLSEVAPGVFETVEVNSQAFPAVTPQEIVEAVSAKSQKWKEQGADYGERWITLAKRCTSVYDYPCGVTISHVILTVSVYNDNGWQAVQTIILDVPMGC